MASKNTPEPFVPYHIINEESLATNYPPDDGAWRTTPISFKSDSKDDFGQWTFEPSGNGTTEISAVGTRFFATVHFREVVGSPERDSRINKWFLEPAGGANFKIKIPDRDIVWTVREVETEIGLQRLLFLEPADGSPSQLFSFKRVIRN